jgi:tRNA pseudouridine13 synthase
VTAASLLPREVPLLTPALPGTGGLVRVSVEDFRVEELPLYEPSGAGAHLYVEVEKTGRTTHDVARELAAALGARERDVGAAGLKDKRAVAVQRLSVPLRPGIEPDEQLARARTAEGPGWRALSAARHGNKLRPGHLRGNRFRVVVRGCAPGALERARVVADALRASGVANLYGPQRFGKRGDNALLGAAILRREATVRDRFLRRLALSALQSELFNRCLAARISSGLFDRPVEGDVLRKRDSGGLFVCDDPAADLPRVRRGEIDPAGPLPGHSLFPARAEALAREQAVLEDAGIDPRSFAAGGGEMEGARRPYRIPAEVDVAEAGEGALAVEFSLPRGSYAIAVLRELTKSPQDATDEPGE